MQRPRVPLTRGTRPYLQYSNPLLLSLSRISGHSLQRVQTTRPGLSSTDSTESRRFIVVVSLHAVSIFETILWNSISPFLSLSLFFFFFFLFESCVRSIAISIDRQYNRHGLQDLAAAAVDSVKQRIPGRQSREAVSSLDFSLASIVLDPRRWKTFCKYLSSIPPSDLVPCANVI